jgi:DNA-binding transcriptional LysR family regulator
MTPNLRQLEVFRLLMRTRNLTETARLLRISQPAISQSLRNLERQFGFELFGRAGGRIVPTTEAVAMLPEVERLFVQITALGARTEELRDERAGSLSIATIPTLTHTVLPKAIQALRRERPRLRVSIESCEQPALLRQIKLDAAEIGFSYSPIMEPGVAAEPIFRTRMVCFLPAGHPLANRPTLGPADLVGTPVAVLSPSTSPGLLLREAFEKHKLANIDLIETNAASAAIGLVKEGGAVALMDVLALFAAGGTRLEAVPFEPDIPLVLTAIYSRQRPVGRVVVRFLAHVRAVLDDLCVELRARGLPGERL